MTPEQARSADVAAQQLDEVAPTDDVLALLDAVATGWLPADVLAGGHPAAGGVLRTLRAGGGGSAPASGSPEGDVPGARAVRDGEGVLIALLEADGTVRPVRPRAAHDAADLRGGPRALRARAGGAPVVLVATSPPPARALTALREAAEASGATPVLLVVVDGDGPAADPDAASSAVRTRAAVALAEQGVVALVPGPVTADPAQRRALAASLGTALGAREVLSDGSGGDAGPDDGRRAVAAARRGTPDDVAEVRRLLPPGVADALLAETVPLERRGVVVLLSGLSGSGKSTVAQVLAARLRALDGRRVTLLDGDVVRRSLTAGLGFGRADRETNVRRIGWVAALVAHHGGTALAAPIAPYAAVRAAVRDDVEAAGGVFVLVHVSTPLEVCEARDRKGLYAAARAGRLTGFTGVDDPYEEPDDADVVVDTSQLSAADAAERVVQHLDGRGVLRRGSPHEKR